VEYNRLVEAVKAMERYTKEDRALQIRSLVDSLPDVREEKVKNLRLQIQKNLYRPDPDEIADRMIEESLEEILWLGRNLN
jgi:anti-sigma28 factor (negative regulator of flagellin synthesis)